MIWTDNPIADAEHYMQDMDEQLESLPICYLCEEHIQQDMAFYYDGHYICDDCIEQTKITI